jgi:Beta-galactosidase
MNREQRMRNGGGKWAGAFALLAFLLSQLTAAAAPAGRPSAPLPGVRLEGDYFTSGGRPFLSVGVHWIPARTGLQWPLAWEPRDIEADFAKMAEMGFNTVRLDLFWAWFEPRPGDYNPVAFEQFDALIALAHRYHLYLNPTLFVGGEVGEAYWDVPWRHGRNPHSDPEMLRLETNLAREFGRRYAHETAILAWDLLDCRRHHRCHGNQLDAAVGTGDPQV